jgi:hypothetical protein
MKVRRTRTAAGASQPAAQVDGGIVLAEPLDQARHVEHAAVLAAPAHSNECHACTRELAERALLLVRAVEGVGCEVQGFEHQWLLVGWTRHVEACKEQKGNMSARELSNGGKPCRASALVI